MGSEAYSSELIFDTKVFFVSKEFFFFPKAVLIEQGVTVSN